MKTRGKKERINVVRVKHKGMDFIFRSTATYPDIHCTGMEYPEENEFCIEIEDLIELNALIEILQFARENMKEELAGWKIGNRILKG